MTAVIVGVYSFMLAVAFGVLVLLAGVVLAVRLAWAVWHRPIKRASGGDNARSDAYKGQT